jgi:hypothetical protein
MEKEKEESTQYQLCYFLVDTFPPSLFSDRKVKDFKLISIDLA